MRSRSKSYAAITCVILALLVTGCAEPQPQTKETASPQRSPASDLVEFVDEERSGSGKCAAYEVVWQNPEAPGEGDPARLDVRRGSESILEVRSTDAFEQLYPQWCGDITDDGRVELGHYKFTGGANCCTEARIDTLGGPTLLAENLGRTTMQRPQQLNDDDALEIPAGRDLQGYFGLPSVIAPIIPRIFGVADGRFVDRTSEFPDYVRKSLTEALRFVDQVQQDEDPGFEAIAGTALGGFGHYVLLNEEQQGLDELAKRVPDDVETWLRERADRAAEAIRSGGPPPE